MENNTGSKYYIVSDLNWQIGQEIKNSTFAKSPHKTFFINPIPLPHRTNREYLVRRKVELRFESYRKKSHPDVPSRKTCIFLNENLADARKWLARGMRAGQHIYELSPVKTIALGITNLIWYNYCIRLAIDPAAELRQVFSSDPELEFQQSMQAYWQNRSTEQFHEPSNAEILFQGVLKVSQRM
jgi:hypothetical protein